MNANIRKKEAAFQNQCGVSDVLDRQEDVKKQEFKYLSKSLMKM